MKFVPLIDSLLIVGCISLMPGVGKAQTDAVINEKPIAINFNILPANSTVISFLDVFAKRNTALAEVTQYLQIQKDKRLIFAGDLNLTPWSPYYKRLVEKTGLHNTKLGFGVEPSWIESATYVHLPAWIIGVIKLPIDHIFVSNDIKVVDCKTIKGGNSDHRMLLSDLVI